MQRLFNETRCGRSSEDLLHHIDDRLAPDEALDAQGLSELDDRVLVAQGQQRLCEGSVGGLEPLDDVLSLLP